MLKITLHDRPESLRFQLEGRLIGAWVRELEQCWTTAVSVRGGRKAIFDLTDVTFIDDSGKELLGKLSQQDIQFVTAGPMTTSIVERITGHACKLVPVSFLVLLLGLAPRVLAQTQPPSPPSAPASGSTPALRLTLRDAVQTALKQNPAIAIANLNIAEAQENAIIDRSALLPQVGITASQAVRRANIEAQLGMTFPSFPQHIGPFWVTQGGVQFSAPLFDLSLYRRYQSGRQATKTAQAQSDNIREENVLLVVSQYLAGLRASADVQAALSRVELAKALLDLATDVQRAGVGTRIDTIRADVQYANEQQRLIASRTNLETTLYGLSRLLNLDPAQRIELTDAVSFFETPAYNAERSLGAAYSSRPEVRALESRVRTLELDRKAAQDERLPRLSVGGAYLQQGLTPATVIPTYNYQLNLDVPLYTGGRIRAETAIADVELRKADQDRQDLRNRIALEVKTAVAQLDAAKSAVDVANRGVKLAQEEVEQARDRFRAGVANNIEIITAQDELARANDNQILALYRYNQARADLARATGQMETLYAR
jgi:outer membrane protein TolC